MTAKKPPARKRTPKKPAPADRPLLDDLRNSRRRMGRPSEITPAQVTAYTAAVYAGANRAESAAVIGLHPETIRNWRHRVEALYGTMQAAFEATIDSDPLDDDRRPPIADIIEFFAHVERAEAAAVTERLNQIRQAARDGTWQAAAWWLERRFPDRFGRRTRHDIGGTGDGAPVEIAVTFDGHPRTITGDDGGDDE